MQGQRTRGRRQVRPRGHGVVAVPRRRRVPNTRTRRRRVPAGEEDSVHHRASSRHRAHHRAARRAIRSPGALIAIRRPRRKVCHGYVACRPAAAPAPLVTGRELGPGRVVSHSRACGSRTSPSPSSCAAGAVEEIRLVPVVRAAAKLDVLDRGTRRPSPREPRDGTRGSRARSAPAPVLADEGAAVRVTPGTTARFTAAAGMRGSEVRRRRAARSR